MDEVKAYRPLKSSHAFHYTIRGVRYAVRMWGPKKARSLVLLHGIRDTSASFQFIVDALQMEWRIIAPDWRGHGGSDRTNYEYWFHDYVADLDQILEILLPDQPADLVGHSLGGNVASVYAGLRPERVAHMISIDAFGFLEPSDTEFADRLSRWLQKGRSQRSPKTYKSIDEMALKLCEANRRLTHGKAMYLAKTLSRPRRDGFTWQFDGSERRSMPTMHTLREWAACWGRITARKLWIAASDIRPGSLAADPKSYAFMVDHIHPESVISIPNTGHSIHHDAPTRLAEIIEGFMCDRDVT